MARQQFGELLPGDGHDILCRGQRRNDPRLSCTHKRRRPFLPLHTPDAPLDPPLLLLLVARELAGREAVAEGALGNPEVGHGLLEGEEATLLGCGGRCRGRHRLIEFFHGYHVGRGGYFAYMRNIYS